jgi:hypothetical protein
MTADRPVGGGYAEFVRGPDTCGIDGVVAGRMLAPAAEGLGWAMVRPSGQG